MATCQKEWRAPMLGLSTISRKNSDFQEVWILIQVAFKETGNWLNLDVERGLTKRQLYSEVLRHKGAVKGSIFRSYLHRLKKAELLWKQGDKWRLTKKALSITQRAT